MILLILFPIILSQQKRSTHLYASYQILYIYHHHHHTYTPLFSSLNYSKSLIWLFWHRHTTKQYARYTRPHKLSPLPPPQVFWIFGVLPFCLTSKRKKSISSLLFSPTTNTTTLNISSLCGERVKTQELLFPQILDTLKKRKTSSLSVS